MTALARHEREQAENEKHEQSVRERIVDEIMEGKMLRWGRFSSISAAQLIGREGIDTFASAEELAVLLTSDAEVMSGVLRGRLHDYASLWLDEHGEGLIQDRLSEAMEEERG